MKRTKIFCLALCLALLLAALPGALGEAETAGQTRRLRLGSSIYTIEIDGSFQYGPVSQEDVADGQVAYLYSNSLAVDFDIYQRGVEGEQPPLAQYTADAAARLNADEVVADSEINGIPVGQYRRMETYNGVEYQTVTYVLDDGEGFVEVVFWLDGEDAENVVKGMIDTLDVDNLAPVRLGSSPYYVFCSASFHEGSMNSADVAEGQVAYWLSDETLLDFDVYQYSKAGLPQNLADYVAGEAAAYNAEDFATDAQVNGIPVGWYRTVAAYEGRDYRILVCVLDAGEEYVEIVFWLDGLTAEAEADAIFQSLWRDDAPDADDEAAQEDVEAVEAAGEWAEEGPEAPAGEPEDDLDEGAAPVDGAEEDGAEAATQLLRLGTSPFTIVVPAGFVEGEMSQEDIEDDQVAYYYSNDTLLDFDVYQFSKDGYPDDLADYTAEEVSGYNEVTDLSTDGEINGIPAAHYRTVEAYQEAEFNTLTYILDGGDEYVELVFWLDGDSADAEADAIIRTLRRDAGEEAPVPDEAAEEVSAPRGGAEEAPLDRGDAAEAPDRNDTPDAPDDAPGATPEEPAVAGE